jgi:uncharacterized protein YndB with AHSA1/START domain
VLPSWFAFWGPCSPLKARIVPWPIAARPSSGGAIPVQARTHFEAGDPRRGGLTRAPMPEARKAPRARSRMGATSTFTVKAQQRHSWSSTQDLSKGARVHECTSSCIARPSANGAKGSCLWHPASVLCRKQLLCVTSRTPFPSATAQPMQPQAYASIDIQAEPASVWQVLVAPQTVTKIMPVTEVVDTWREGEPFLWRVHLNDWNFEVKGRVVRMTAAEVLEYDYLDPHDLAFAERETWHHVSISLTPTNDGTHVLVTQDNHTSEAAHRHAEGGWRLALWNLKSLVEERTR